MLHERSAESMKSKVPVFSRRILGSVKTRKAGSYVSILTCTIYKQNCHSVSLYCWPHQVMGGILGY